MKKPQGTAQALQPPFLCHHQAGKPVTNIVGSAPQREPTRGLFPKLQTAHKLCSPHLPSALWRWGHTFPERDTKPTVSHWEPHNRCRTSFKTCESALQTAEGQHLEFSVIRSSLLSLRGKEIFLRTVHKLPPPKPGKGFQGLLATAWQTPY